MLPVPGVLVYLLKHMPHRKTMLIVYLSFNLDYSLLVLTEGALVKVICFCFSRNKIKLGICQVLYWGAFCLK